MTEQCGDSIGRIGLLNAARETRQKAFAPFSEYPVGAALLADGTIYTGANIEVSGRNTSVHAEMMAAYNAVLDRAFPFEMLAVSPDGLTGVAICGLCQHTLAQWTDDLLILEDVGDDDPVEYQLEELIGPAYSPSTRHQDLVNQTQDTDTDRSGGGE